VSEDEPFVKTPKQIEATKLAGGRFLKHFMAYGGSRSGKTFDHVRRIFIRAMKEPNSRHLILRLQFNAVKTSVWHETIPDVLKLCFPEVKVKINKSDYYITVPGESEVWIAGLDGGERTEKVLGKEYSTIFFNECSQISLEGRNIALTRLAQKNKLRKIAYYDQNPPSKKHWAYWLWERNFDPLAEEKVDPSEYVSIHMNPADNIKNIDSDYLKLLGAMPKVDRDRFLLGLYSDDDDGLAYYEFDRERHVKEVARTSGTVHGGMDFNVSPMTCALGQYDGYTFYIFDEIFLRNSDTYRMAKHLRDKNLGGVQLVPDSTGKNRKTSGKSDFDILKENGFSILHSRNPFVTDRVNNINRLLAANRIVIDPKCKKLINDLEQVSWKDNKLDQKTNSMLTHISDALGYMCWKLDKIEKISDAKIRTH